MNYLNNKIFIDTGKKGMYQKAFINRHYNDDPVPKASYQMLPSQIHHNHHQQHNINV